MAIPFYCAVLLWGQQSQALSVTSSRLVIHTSNSKPTMLSRPRAAMHVETRGMHAPSRKLPVLKHGGHSHGHHEHGHDEMGGLGLTWGTAAKALVVAFAVYALPMPALLPAAAGMTPRMRQLKGSLAVALGCFLLLVEGTKGVWSETRVRLGRLYRTILVHQASARTAGLTNAAALARAPEGRDAEGSPEGGGGKQLRESASDTRAANRVTQVGALVNVGLAGFKLLVGVLSGSAAMVADAGHSLSDLVSDVVTLVALRVSRLPPDEDHPWGHGRFEALGALAIAVLLFSTALGFGSHASNAFQRELTTLLTSTTAAPGAGAAAAAATASAASAATAASANPLGAVLSFVKGVLFHSHSHGEGHAHLGGRALGYVAALGAALVSIASKEWLFQATKRVGERLHSQVLVANAWHHRSDALSSVVALVGIGGACAGFPLLDPLAGLGVAGMVAITGLHVGWDALKQLTDTVDGESVLKATAIALAVEGVVGVDESSVRARRMGSDTLVDLVVHISPHVPSSGANQVAETVRWRIRNAMPEVSEVLVHVMALSPQKQCPMLAYAVRSAVVIEADVRKALRSAPHLMKRQGGGDDSTPSSLKVRTVHRVTVHYLNLQPCVEVLLDVVSASTPEPEPTLAELRLLGHRAKEIIEAEVPDVTAAEVHLRLADSPEASPPTTPLPSSSSSSSFPFGGSTMAAAAMGTTAPGSPAEPLTKRPGTLMEESKVVNPPKKEMA